MSKASAWAMALADRCAWASRAGEPSLEGSWPVLALVGPSLGRFLQEVFFAHRFDLRGERPRALQHGCAFATLPLATLRGLCRLPLEGKDGPWAQLSVAPAVLLFDSSTRLRRPMSVTFQVCTENGPRPDSRASRGRARSRARALSAGRRPHQV